MSDKVTSVGPSKNLPTLNSPIQKSLAVSCATFANKIAAENGKNWN